MLVLILVFFGQFTLTCKIYRYISWSVILAERQGARECRVFPVKAQPFGEGFPAPELDDILPIFHVKAAYRWRRFAPIIIGRLFENWVGQELMHRCLYSGRAYRLSFWRTAHGAEVDYVLETPDKTIPIEVKATDAPSHADASHLKLFLETYPKKAHRGFLVCRCRAPRRLADNIEAIPWQNL